MAIRITFGQEPKSKYGKYLFGHVYVDGVEISRRVQTVRFDHNGDGSNILTLGIVLYGDDTVDLEIPEEDVVVNGKVIRSSDDLVEVTAVGDAAMRYLRVK